MCECCTVVTLTVSEELVPRAETEEWPLLTWLQGRTKGVGLEKHCAILVCFILIQSERDKQVHLLRDGRVAEGSSGARLDRVELWGVTEGGNRDNGAEGATLVLLPKDGESGFGVEELDVAKSRQEVEMFVTRDSELKRNTDQRKNVHLQSRAAEVLTPLKPFCSRRNQTTLGQLLSHTRWLYTLHS